MGKAFIALVLQRQRDGRCARFVSKVRDDRTRVQNELHDACEDSSNPISCRLRAAKASLEVRTCAYLPRTERTRAGRVMPAGSEPPNSGALNSSPNCSGVKALTASIILCTSVDIADNYSNPVWRKA